MPTSMGVRPYIMIQKSPAALARFSRLGTFTDILEKRFKEVVEEEGQLFASVATDWGNPAFRVKAFLKAVGEGGSEARTIVEVHSGQDFTVDKDVLLAACQWTREQLDAKVSEALMR